MARRITGSATRRVKPETALKKRLVGLDDSLVPEPRRVAVARQRAERLIEELNRGQPPSVEVLEHFEHGSLSRGTGLAGFADIDYIIVLKKSVLTTILGAELTPRAALQKVTAAINSRHGGLRALGYMEARTQEHSVGVSYPQSKLRIDLVPALRVRQDRLRIPHCGSNQWVDTWRDRARKRLEQASSQDPDVVRAVRLLKSWCRARGNRVSLPSYAIELLVVERALQGTRGLVPLVTGFFMDIGDQDARGRLALRSASAPDAPIVVEDPDSGANVTGELTAAHRRALIAACRRASKEIAELLALLGENPEARVDSRLRALFRGSW